MKIDLTKLQISNLQTFLQRVDLKGSEVPAFIEIVNALNYSTNENNQEMQQSNQTKETD